MALISSFEAVQVIIELHEGNNTLRADERSCLHGYLPATLGRSDLYEFKNL